MVGIKKMVIHYGTISDADRKDIIAKEFDLIDCGWSQDYDVGKMKASSATMEAIGYMDVFLVSDYRNEYDVADNGNHEHWFLHDKYGDDVTHRVSGTAAGGYANYAMIPHPSGNGAWGGGSDSWAWYYASTQSYKAYDSNGAFDGIFMDDFMKDIYRDGMTLESQFGLSSQYITDTYGRNVETVADIDQNIRDYWPTAMAKFQYSTQVYLNNIMPEGRRIVMRNSWKWCQEHLVPTDKASASHLYLFWEHFLHGMIHTNAQDGYGEWYSQLAIDRMHSAALSGCYIAALGGTSNYDDDPVIGHRWQVFTLAAFLMSVEDITKSYYCWNFYNRANDASNGYFSEMNYVFGQPVSEFVFEDGTGDLVLSREFDNYYAVVNIDVDDPHTVTVGGTEITLTSGSGCFLQKATPATTGGALSIYGISPCYTIGDGRLTFYGD